MGEAGSGVTLLCEYPNCGKVAIWAIDAPAAWEAFVCDDHREQRASEYRKLGFVPDVWPFQRNGREDRR